MGVAGGRKWKSRVDDPVYYGDHTLCNAVSIAPLQLVAIRSCDYPPRKAAYSSLADSTVQSLARSPGHRQTRPSKYLSLHPAFHPESMTTVSSSSRPAENLPGTARAIALLLSATPSVQDVQPGVLHQLLEFSHRYTAQVLTDASVYAEHAGRGGKIDMDDVILAVQARVGWEFGGRVPKEVHFSYFFPMDPCF